MEKTSEDRIPISTLLETQYTAYPRKEHRARLLLRALRKKATVGKPYTVGTESYSLLEVII